MKAARLVIALCLVFSVTACHRQSSDPKKDIVGAWKSSDNKHMYLSLRADGTATRSYEFLAPSDFEQGTYTLNTDPSGINILTLTLRRRTFAGTESSTKSFEAAVYPDALILGTGAAEIPLARIPKKADP